MERVTVVHGWGGSPDKDWMPWSKTALATHGYEVLVPEMPSPEDPQIEPWIAKISGTIGTVRKSDILVGHSIGCLAILRYLGTLNEEDSLQKVILIAPWQYLSFMGGEDDTITKRWLEDIPDYSRIKLLASQFIVVLSDNDSYVPLESNMHFFKEKLDPEIIVKKGMGHFTSEDGCSELSFLLDLL